VTGVRRAVVVGGGLMGSGIDAEAARAATERLTYVTDLDALPECELAIEAVVEDPLVKREIFARLDRLLPAHALIASNTSSIPIAELGAATGRPGQVLGLHFFSPAPVMALGKTAIPTKDRSGFIVTMLLVPYLVAAVRMYEDGFATADAIDTGMRLGCGHPMGPLALCDLIGLGQGFYAYAEEPARVG
jgi:3-hydroxybutyryl-CoA dehydrogenase